MENFEKLGVFYLGRPYDLAAGKPKEGYLLYDSKDLLTHGVCVGMTGSGKTGLCVSLLEEAAMDGIPAIVIDPKGDMTNLLLSFPDLSPSDFRPWINEDDARKKDLSPDEFAAQQATVWQNGLAAWGQDGERIRQMRQNTDFAVYTPGSTAGIPVSILRSFAAPPPAIMTDDELLRDQVSGTAGSLLGLIGLDADPIKSREHILLSTIILHMWQKGIDLDLASLISLIQEPPITQIGVMSLDSFYPANERFSLAIQFNNLLASPGFATWLTGDPLDIDQILYSSSGKPKISIFSIAHLSEAERLFFVSLILNQILVWTRMQSGTSSLRAILYMDEIFGYFPPIANPPTKRPLLTLLKQARAYGLGIMLTTQNPVDLDYKGLANTGTWFIGRLQTERDKMRVMEGLEGASATQGVSFDRAKMEQILAGLGNRIFLMNNVHDDQPTLFETRWCMSYLRGPLTRSQIQMLTPGKSSVVAKVETDATNPLASNEKSPVASTSGTKQPIESLPPFPSAQSDSVYASTQGANNNLLPPVLPQEVRQYFMPVRGRSSNHLTLLYKPMALGNVQVGFRNVKANVQQSQDSIFVTDITDSVFPVDWDKATLVDISISDLETSGGSGARYAPLPAIATSAKSYSAWNRDLANWVFQTQQLTLLQCPVMKMTAAAEESERDFQIRLAQAAREIRDQEVNRLRQKYELKIQALQEKIRRSEQAVEREQQQAKQQQMQTAISFGATLLSSFMGKKRINASSLGRATTAVRGASRTMKEKGDVARSQETVETYREQLAGLEEAFKIETDSLAVRLDTANEVLVPLNIRPAKQDILVKALILCWMPFIENTDGSDEPAWG